MLLVFFLLSTIGCHSITLTMAPEREMRDNSVLTKDLETAKYKKIMVIPPQGTVRGEFDSNVATFEREFLKKGVTVISAAVTGRVVLESAGKEEKGGQIAVNLSDAERALVMAKQTGADAILQIGLFQWNNSTATRFFIRTDDAYEYKEVTKQEFRTADHVRKISYPASVLRFVGRLIDVQSGEVRATFDIENAANWNMPAKYEATIREKGENNFIDSENYSYERADWNEIQKATLEKTIQQVVDRVAIGTK